MAARGAGGEANADDGLQILKSMVRAKASGRKVSGSSATTDDLTVSCSLLTSSTGGALPEWHSRPKSLAPPLFPGASAAADTSNNGIGAELNPDLLRRERDELARRATTEQFADDNSVGASNRNLLGQLWRQLRPRLDAAPLGERNETSAAAAVARFIMEGKQNGSAYEPVSDKASHVPNVFLNVLNASLSVELVHIIRMALLSKSILRCLAQRP